MGDENGNLPLDYKFYCLNGESKYVMICTDREIGKTAKFYYYDKNWKMMPFTQDAIDNPKAILEKPDLIDEAFDYAEKLAKGFPFVRVDLYIVGNKIYFGELTFTPSAGMDKERLPYTDRVIGEMLELKIEV